MQNDLKKFDIKRNYVDYKANYIWAKINDNYYHVQYLKGEFFIVSKSMINENSSFSNNCYYTKINFEEIDDLISEQLYAEYKGRIFSVGFVSDKFEKIVLSANYLTKNESEEYGFEYSRDFGRYMLELNNSEVTLLSSQESILDRVVQNKRTMSL